MQQKEIDHQNAIANLKQQLESSQWQTEIIRSTVDNE